MTSPVDIKDVIYMPNLLANLLSVSTLDKRGLAVVFTDKGSAIYKKEELKITGVPILTATQKMGCINYIMKIKSILSHNKE